MINFHSQFQVSDDSYIDNNNFIRKNNIIDDTDRLALNGHSHQEFTFYDYLARPKWLRKPNKGTRLTRRHNDGYQTPKAEQYEMYFGAYFFASEESVEQTRTVVKITEILGNLGGIYGLL